jgi:endonuclease YncB( thermonuclease family)
VTTLFLLLAMGSVLTGAGVAQSAPQAPGPIPMTAMAGNLAVPGESSKPSTWGTVRTVYDAKSLAVTLPELTVIELRLLGVEPPVPPLEGRKGVPPTPGQPFGPQAVKYLRDLLADKQVRFDAYGKDRSGRTLAVVWLGDVNVNLTLVKEGLAWVSPHIANVAVRAELEVAERQAQVGKYGLWALPNPEAPWKYRQGHRLPAE